MSALTTSLADYLALRRGLGYGLVRQEKLIKQFLEYLSERQESEIKTELALAWANSAGGGAAWHSYRLQAVRGFARYLRAQGEPVEIPAAELLPGQPQRATPYLYCEAEIEALIGAASSLGSPHRTATFQTLIGLLAVTGMRIGEAIGLNRGDFDSSSEVLTVRRGKGGRSRELPLHSSAATALLRYLRRRDRPGPPPGEDPLLVSAAGTRLLIGNVQTAFRALRERAAIPRLASGRGPRIHDIRHSFAVRTLIDAHREGADVGRRLALLSTYLGHVDPASTYWYLDASPELMALASARLESYLNAPVPGAGS